MSGKPDVRIRSCRLYFLPVENRVPLKFGHETVRAVTCARAAVTVENHRGDAATGWGETPLNIPWVWPSPAEYEERGEAARSFCRLVAADLPTFGEWGHPLELGHLYTSRRLPVLREHFNAGRSPAEALPWLATLACASAFDLALHDAYATLAGAFTYAIYDAKHMNHDLAWYFDQDEAAAFRGKYPADFLTPMRRSLPAWHLVGGADALSADEIRGDEPDDGYPVRLDDWIRRDGLSCLKVKLSGDDPLRDLERLTRVGRIGRDNGAQWLCADFNCTVEEPEYVLAILDRLEREQPWLYAMILYLEQPFPRDLEARRLDVRAVSSRKPLFMDESADGWERVRLGHGLGWNGVALKTCKTQTGALLALCWAKTRGMPIMVQDLTNPMLAQIPHLLLAAHADTLMGVETNAMQFYPEASRPEARVHPGLYTRRNGRVMLDSLGTVGFGYRVAEIGRVLPEAEETGRSVPPAPERRS